MSSVPRRVAGASKYNAAQVERNAAQTEEGHLLRWKLRFAGIVCLLVLCAASGQAQSRIGDLGYGFSVGYSPASAELLGTTKHRKLLMFDAQFNVAVASGHGLALRYTPELTLFGLLHEPGEYLIEQAVYEQPRYVRGAGTSPLGLQLSFRDDRRLQPYIGGHGGMLYFNRQVPVPDSSQFNFAFGWEGGIEWRASGRNWLRVAYRFHHVSNDNTGHYNPGVDSNLILFGWTRRKR